MPSGRVRETLHWYSHWMLPVVAHPYSLLVARRMPQRPTYWMLALQSQCPLLTGYTPSILALFAALEAALNDH